jgi:hypothetical protein
MEPDEGVKRRNLQTSLISYYLDLPDQVCYVNTSNLAFTDADRKAGKVEGQIKSSSSFSGKILNISGVSIRNN